MEAYVVQSFEPSRMNAVWLKAASTSVASLVNQLVFRNPRHHGAQL